MRIIYTKNGKSKKKNEISILFGGFFFGLIYNRGKTEFRIERFSYLALLPLNYATEYRYYPCACVCMLQNVCKEETRSKRDEVINNVKRGSFVVRVQNRAECKMRSRRQYREIFQKREK